MSVVDPTAHTNRTLGLALRDLLLEGGVLVADGGGGGLGGEGGKGEGGGEGDGGGGDGEAEGLLGWRCFLLEGFDVTFTGDEGNGGVGVGGCCRSAAVISGRVEEADGDKGEGNCAEVAGGFGEGNLGGCGAGGTGG